MDINTLLVLFMDHMDLMGSGLMAKGIGHTSISKVERWKKDSFIPISERERVIGFLKSEGVIK